MSDELLWNGGALIAIAGTLLLVWALFGDRARGRRRCPRCWYDMSATQGRRCPECGHEAAAEKRLFKTRNRWKWALASVIVFIVAAFVYIQPTVREHGWAAIAPNTYLILSTQSRDNLWAFAELDRRVLTDIGNFNPTVTGFSVPDTSRLYQWQWRIIGNTCIDLLERDATVSDRMLLLQWMSRSMEGLDDADSMRIFRVMTTLLQDENSTVREQAAIYCANSRRPADAVAAIRSLLNDPDARVRIGAVTGLRLLARSSHEPLDALYEALKHEDWQVRMYAAAALGSMAHFSNAPMDVFDVVADVYENDPHMAVRTKALRACCQFPSRRNGAIQLMSDALASEEPMLRAAALDELASMESFDASLDIDAAIQGIRDSSPLVRQSAAWLLRYRVPTEALADHVHLLQSLANDPNENEHVREAANFHLNQVDKISE